MVARRQLLEAGVTSSMVDRWLASRRLLLLHRGVYAVGHRALRREGYWLAAVLAAGPGAALSHREAAALHELRPSNRPSIDLTAAVQRRVPGVQIHRVRVLDAVDVSVVDGIPVTTIARTLVDLAGVVPAVALRKALEEAERSNRLDVGAIVQVLDRTRQRRGHGHGAIRAALKELGAVGSSLTRSVLEDRFGALLATHGLPRPRTNALVEGIEVDALWDSERVVVELDGWAFHRTTQAFQRDRERSNDLLLAGYVVLRFTHDDVVRRPARVAAAVGRALARGAARTAYAVAPTG